MWTALFIIAIAAAIGFVLAAARLQPQVQNAAPDATLLPRRMRLLHIDPAELARAEPRSFGNSPFAAGNVKAPHNARGIFPTIRPAHSTRTGRIIA